MSEKVNHQALQFVLLADMYAKKASQELAGHEAKAAAAQAIAPQVLTKLQQSNLITAAQIKQAAEILSDHKRTLDLVTELAGLVAQKQAEVEKNASTLPRLGGPARDSNESGAEFDAINSPFVGMPTSQKKPSDMAYEARLYGNPR